MYWSKLLIPTLKETPKEAEIISHSLMIKGGFIRKLASGIYNILPLGLKVLKKIENIIREELDNIGCQELLLSTLQPKELWEETSRWNLYGEELIKIKDRHNRNFCLGPTHEEIITDIIRKEIKSYKNLPQIFYQFQTKFRDEIRPRFGIMRCREFLMKDAYSFDVDEKYSEKNYQKVLEAYKKIFSRCGLKFTTVEASSGNIGGILSHEFIVIADSGETKIVTCKNCGYSANIEKVECKIKDIPTSFENKKNLEEISTFNIKTVKELTSFFNCNSKKIIKTLLYQTEDKIIAVLLRGDHEVNETKLKNVLNASDLKLLSKEEILELTGIPIGFTGPTNLKELIPNIEIIGDTSISYITNAITGSNKKDTHFINVNIDRDFKLDKIEDIRMVEETDLCPKCFKNLEFNRGIEVGHAFKLGTKYSKSMKATFINKNGQEKEIVMGCFGIGIGRTMTAAIEQNYDQDGIIWPISIAPYEVLVLPININNIFQQNLAYKLYNNLKTQKVEVLLDDRDERAGKKFKDADLIGIPLRIIIGEKILAEQKIELQIRKNKEKIKLEYNQIILEIKKIIEKEKKSC